MEEGYVIGQFVVKDMKLINLSLFLLRIFATLELIYLKIIRENRMNRLTVIALTGVLALGLTACGEHPTKPTTTTTETTTDENGGKTTETTTEAPDGAKTTDTTSTTPAESH